MSHVRRFRGVYPVLYAFWGRDGRLDEGAMRAQVEHCLAAGAHGVTMLGLVTEVLRMDTAERRSAMAMVGAAVGGRVPYAVTIAERDADGQVAFARAARDAGADWVVLQPPPGKGLDDAALTRHFGSIADRLDLPCAIQNNPLNLDSALSPDGLVRLVRAHGNIRLLKAEGWSVEIARVLAALGNAVDAFGGHGGLEFIGLMRSGAAGLIPAPDVLALQVAMFQALTSGDPARAAVAERAHLTLLPLVVFMTTGGIAAMHCYGKRVMARRIGLREVLDRPGGMEPNAFGLAEADRMIGAVMEQEAALIREMRAEKIAPLPQTPPEDSRPLDT